MCVHVVSANSQVPARGRVQVEYVREVASLSHVSLHFNRVSAR